MLKRILSFSNIRRICAISFFILLIWLFYHTSYESLMLNNYPVNAFLKLDPLIILSSFIASQSFDFWLFLIASITIVLTFIFGRFFCSWVCPLGFLNQLVSKIRFSKTKTSFNNKQYIKYYILVFVFLCSIFSIQIAGWFDPLAIWERTLAISIFPAISAGLNSLIDFVNNTPALNNFYDPLWSFQMDYFPPSKIEFSHSTIILAIFLIILALNLIRNRFWCNYICPLGAFLGLIGNYSIFKIRQDNSLCTNCAICSSGCPANADPHMLEELKHFECFVCGKCINKCPASGLTYSYAFKQNNQEFLPDRRNIILSSFLALGSWPLFSLLQDKERPVIRPPGSVNESKFVDKCINCGKCVKACPNNAIQLTLFEAGPEGIFTPQIIPSIGYCEYSCNACTQVCPTGAIIPLTTKAKQNTPIGIAIIDKKACLPYTINSPCLVCEEHCPVPDKAIKIIEENNIGKPVIDTNLCIGCGICENKCPATPEVAIKVFPLKGNS